MILPFFCVLLLSLHVSGGREDDIRALHAEIDAMEKSISGLSRTLEDPSLPQDDDLRTLAAQQSRLDGLYEDLFELENTSDKSLNIDWRLFHKTAEDKPTAPDNREEDREKARRCIEKTIERFEKTKSEIRAIAIRPDLPKKFATHLERCLVKLGSCDLGAVFEPYQEMKEFWKDPNGHIIHLLEELNLFSALSDMVTTYPLQHHFGSVKEMGAMRNVLPKIIRIAISYDSQFDWGNVVLHVGSQLLDEKAYPVPATTGELLRYRLHAFHEAVPYFEAIRNSEKLVEMFFPERLKAIQSLRGEKQRKTFQGYKIYLDDKEARQCVFYQEALQCMIKRYTLWFINEESPQVEKVRFSWKNLVWERVEDFLRFGKRFYRPRADLKSLFHYQIEAQSFYVHKDKLKPFCVRIKNGKKIIGYLSSHPFDKKSMYEAKKFLEDEKNELFKFVFDEGNALVIPARLDKSINPDLWKTKLWEAAYQALVTDFMGRAHFQA